ncbi:unnamed protein product [Pieris macdunnoughi]|uniref:Uncharacterized protein n=1 Tax=Pieris macdunnoughi TaxID=345717 RepID=A0A821SCK0_9NEOP|nr:unnamed protein product [Pieris macdunnoughi]
MLCPDICKFSAPKTICSLQKNLSFTKTLDRIRNNCFYRSVIITCPDEIKLPNSIEEAVLEDSDYYKILNCPITEFIDPTFIETFIKKGKLYCLSILNSCMNHNGFAVTSDGLLTLHVLSSVYQTLGIEGTKCPHDFYDIKIDLYDIKSIGRLSNNLNKLDKFNLYINWEPNNENVCPSTIAKYFCDKNYVVTQHSLKGTNLSPDIGQIPSLDADIVEVVEWMGMVAHNANLMPPENFVSSYYIPESLHPMQTTRISVMLIKGFLTPNLLCKVAQHLFQHVSSRDLANYWSALSLQTVEESLYQWYPTTSRIFQSHNSSTNIFFTSNDAIIYSVGHLKYS